MRSSTATRARRIGIVLPPAPGGWDGKSTAVPIVWKEDEKTTCWVRVRGMVRGLGCSVLVMKPTKGAWEDGFECGSLLKINNKYWLYYSGFGADGKIRIGLVYSLDCKVWVRCPDNPVFPLTEHTGTPHNLRR